MTNFLKLALFTCLIIPSGFAKESTKVEEEGISTGRYVTGGIISSVVGLGIGHGIQRRYLPLGLVFTIGQAAGWTAFFADSERQVGIISENRHHVGTVGVIGLCTVLGLHIWEVVDSWVVGNELNEIWKENQKKKGNVGYYPQPSFTIAPVLLTQNTPGMVFGLRF